MLERMCVFIYACAVTAGEGAHVLHAWDLEVVPMLAGSGGDEAAHVTVLVPAHRPR